MSSSFVRPSEVTHPLGDLTLRCILRYQRPEVIFLHDAWEGQVLVLNDHRRVDHPVLSRINVLTPLILSTTFFFCLSSTTDSPTFPSLSTEYILRTLKELKRVLHVRRRSTTLTCPLSFSIFDSFYGRILYHLTQLRIKFILQHDLLTCLNPKLQIYVCMNPGKDEGKDFSHHVRGSVPTLIHGFPSNSPSSL